MVRFVRNITGLCVSYIIFLLIRLEIKKKFNKISTSCSVRIYRVFQEE